MSPSETENLLGTLYIYIYVYTHVIYMYINLSVYIYIFIHITYLYVCLRKREIYIHMSAYVDPYYACLFLHKNNGFVKQTHWKTTHGLVKPSR